MRSRSNTYSSGKHIPQKKDKLPDTGLIHANDVDRVVAQMCYIQLSLLGCPGWVAVANTISNPVCGDPLMPDERPGQEFWYTPFISGKNGTIDGRFRSLKKYAVHG